MGYERTHIFPYPHRGLVIFEIQGTILAYEDINAVEG